MSQNLLRRPEKMSGNFWGGQFFPYSNHQSRFFRHHPVFGAWKRETHTICQFTWQVRKLPCLRTFKGHDYTTQPKHFTRTNDSKKNACASIFLILPKHAYIYIYREIYIDLLETPLTIEIQVMLKMVKVLATDFASQLSHGKKKLVSRGLSVAEVFRTGGPHKEPHIPI